MDSTTLAVHVPCVTSCPDYDVRLVTNIFDVCVGKGEKGEIGERERDKTAREEGKRDNDRTYVE